MHAIPTKYKGIQFRSRLEATWAAFFDLLGWKWEYEPCDFDGWIPDFLLRFERNIFVEVKPWARRKEIVAEPAWNGCGFLRGECDLLICGIAPLIEGHSLTIGWISSLIICESGGFVLEHEQLTLAEDGLFTLDMTYTVAAPTRWRKCPDGFGGATEREFFVWLWAQAKNATQWRAPRD